MTQLLLDIIANFIEISDSVERNSLLNFNGSSHTAFSVIEKLLEGRGDKSEPAGDICPEHSGLNGLDVTPNIRLALQNVAVFRHLVQLRLLLVRENYVGVESFNAEKSLTQCSRTFSQNLIRLHRNDGAESVAERVDILHVEIVGSHSIRN